MEPEKYQVYIDQLILGLTDYGPNVLAALLVLVVGWQLIKSLVRMVNSGLQKQGIDPSLRPFLCSLLSISLKVLLIISVASMVGIATTSFVAVVGAAGLAVGLALQGSLANFAGGALILFFRPFKVGDYIKAQGVAGTVKEIQVFCTLLQTPDNRIIIVPNGPLAGDVIENVSREPQRRVDLVFGISYNDDIDQAKKTISDTVGADSRVLKDPEMQVIVSELADSSVNITVRAWVDAGDYWDVYFATLENVKKALDANNITIPFPTQEVHWLGNGQPTVQ